MCQIILLHVNSVFPKSYQSGIVRYSKPLIKLLKETSWNLILQILD